MSKIAPENKPVAMSAIAQDFAVIKAAQAEVHKLDVLMAAKIREFVGSFGPGPHKMAGPDGHDLIVTFRKSGDVFTVHALDLSAVS